MPSQEAKILGDFLLTPAPLRDFITLREFTDIFPRAHRANPAVQEIYRELQRLREKDIELVRQDIVDEVKRSKQLRREYAQERRQVDDATVAGLDPVALQMEEELSGQGRKKLHTLQTVHPDIDEACQSLEAQIAEIEQQNEDVLREVQDVIGALSDLRHGRFAPSNSGEDLGEEVMATLKRLEAVLSLVSWTEPVAGELRITADHHSFGGVNYPQLQFFTPKHRDNTIREIISSGARVIRLFSQLKVIIAPHDAHALRGSNGVPCDAYCKKLNGAFLDFYSLDEYRDLYKTRLEVFFKHYPSKNFSNRPWGTLSEIILGVDLQHQPFSGIFPIPAGESWLCDMATFLKFSIGLDSSDIAVISGGVSGPQKIDEFQNFPDSVFDCKAIDVIGIHGYFSKQKDATAGTPWADMFVPGNTLTSRAKGKKGKGKLLLVEEWGYVHSEEYGLFYKKEAIFDQGNALNLRGIPWLYSHLTTLTEEKSPRINPLHPTYTAWAALKNVLTHSRTTRSNFNWNPYLAPPTRIIPPSEDEKTAQHLRSMLTGESTQEWKLAPLGLSNLTAIPLNPYTPQQAERNSEGQPGKVGDRCDSKARCQPHLRCEKSVEVGGEGGKAKTCTACVARKTIQKPKGLWRRRSFVDDDYTDTDTHSRDQDGRLTQPNDPQGSCLPDSPTLIFTSSSSSPNSNSNSNPSATPPTCLPPSPALPCTQQTHCPASSYCANFTCHPCTASDACLGAVCTSNKKCKTGVCNEYGRCDYAASKKKRSFGPGGARMGKKLPSGMERGPARVRSEAMRIVIPTEGVRETGWV
ncbi:glycoside hydrolase family 5 protein [Stemphylium lycopersici]|uniref:Glycoside hydrolase family 5 protein n=1 Tax=Stemphylium lycopersici TaxID=183478 RepID=A0A364N345_STELY|nr:glycoside hydrolase family 5 protein [Stemphylium lycopersici]RAR10776.1 glycoside hydrolase family 5 protein [Stemphylium lycopersici]